MADYDFAAIAAWLDSVRPGWRTEDPAAVVSWIQTPSIQRYRVPTRITDRTILRLFGLVRGDEILTAFAQIAAGGGVAARVWTMLQDRAADGVGIDTDDGQSFVDQMVAAGALTTDEAAQLKALAIETVSPAEYYGHDIRCPTVIDAAREVV